MSIPRTALLQWSPDSISTPLLATGTVSGALDASFSSDSLLELWSPFTQLNSTSTSSSLNSNSTSSLLGLPEEEIDLLPIATVTVSSRFNRLAWGYVKSPDRPKGVIAAGFENGEIGLWDPEIMINSNKTGADPLIARYDLHKGPVRGLDFNPHQTNLLASGATEGEIYIWDLTTPNKPYSPGTRSRSMNDITSLAWNSRVAHVLATGSDSGYTVVWDLKTKREVTALSYTGIQASGVGNGFGGQSGWGGAGKGGVSCVKWHPNNPTKLVTASDDDQNPVIMMWDLRNWKEPERILTGHEKGILSLSWCSKDADLLLSTGKDGRTLCWNPSSGDIVAELTPSSNWSFDVEWCPRNPSMLATASLSGKVTVQSIQSTAAPPTPSTTAPSSSLAPGVDGADIFATAISGNASNYPTKSLVQTPAWLKRPASATFGFGGKLVVIGNDKVNGPSVEIREIKDQPAVLDRALRLENATATGSLEQFCDERSSEVVKDGEGGEVANWKLLKSLFGQEGRGELVEMLGFSKEEVRAKVNEAVKALKSKGLLKSGETEEDDDDLSSSITREPQVTFSGASIDGSSEGEAAAAHNNNHHNRSGSGTLDGSVTTSESTTKLASEAESEVTEQSLFGDDPGAVDFFSQIGSGRPAALPDHLFARDAVANSSVAATIGSASSVASLNLKATTFKIYTTTEEAEIDRLITRALILGDFESAVNLSLTSERYADAILLSVRGGPELLAKTQKIYFERHTSALPYLRVFQSIVANDLTDVVQNAELSEWQEIFVVLCTFASSEDYPGLVEQLGVRLEHQYAVVKQSPTPEFAPELRKNAILCYLAAGQLEKVVGVWLQQMEEEEEATRVADKKAGKGSVQFAASKKEARSKALQTFVEKVTVFQHAVGYVDIDLSTPTDISESGARTYKLAALYERYVEYAELLAAQGLTSIALKFIQQTPSDFEGAKTKSTGPALTRDRLARATGMPHDQNIFSSSSKILEAPVASTSSFQAPSAQAYQYPTAAAYDQQYQSQNQYSQQSYSAPAPVYAPVQTPLRQNSYANTNVTPQDPRRPSYPQQQQQQSQTPNYTQSSMNDDPYGPPATSAYGGPPTAYGAPQAQSSYATTQPYPPNPNYSSTYGQPSAYAQPSAYPGVPNAGGNYIRRDSFIPAPPAIREASPDFSNRGLGSNAPPPPRAKTEGQWNDAPALIPRKVPAPSVTPKPTAITSPFPNMQMSPTSSGAGHLPGQVPPPPPPSRGGNRTPAPSSIPPPPQGRGFPPPPMPIMQPQQIQQQFAAPPPPQQRQQQPPPPPPPASRGGPPPPQQSQQQQQQQGPPQPNFSGPPPPQPNGGGAYGRPVAPPTNSGPYGPPAGQQAPPQTQAGPLPPQQQQQQQQRPPPPPSGPYGPPPGAARGAPPPPQGLRGGPPPPPPAVAAPPPPKIEAPKTKFPPGDRTHIPAASRPIFDVLSNEVKRLKQITPPQQAKIIADIEKRLNVLFDMLNCETLSPTAHASVLDIVKAIEVRNQQEALALHLAMITQGNTGEVAAFQAALKLVIQRL